MLFSKFLFLAKTAYGRSYQAQLADYLLISRKTVSSWVDRSFAPDWLEPELEKLLNRKAKEVKLAEKIFNLDSDDFLHESAILNGEVHYYDLDKYSLANVLEFIGNQRWTVGENAKKLILQDECLADIINFVDDCFLSSDDIAQHVESCATEEELDAIKEARGDACSDVKLEVEDLYNRFHKI